MASSFSADTANFAIGQFALGRRTQVAMTAQDVEDLRAAREKIKAVREFEEQYFALIQALYEFELELIKFALEHMLRPFDLTEIFGRMRKSVNLRAVTFLTTSRLFVDAFSKKATAFSNQTAMSVAATVKESISCSRTFAELNLVRNFAQHFGLPTHMVKLGGAWLDFEQGSKQVHTATANISLAELATDRRNDRYTIERLRADAATHVDLAKLFRMFCNEAGHLHKAVRQLTADEVEQALGEIELWVGRVENLDDGKETLTNLVVVRHLNAQEFEELYFLGSEHRKTLKALIGSNYCHENIDSACVSSQRLS